MPIAFIISAVPLLTTLDTSGFYMQYNLDTSVMTKLHFVVT